MTMIPAEAELAACVFVCRCRASARATLLSALEPRHFGQAPCADWWRAVLRHEGEQKAVVSHAIVETLVREKASVPQSPSGWSGWELAARDASAAYLERGGLTNDERAEELVRDIRNAAELRDLRVLCAEVAGRAEQLREFADDLRHELLDRAASVSPKQDATSMATLRDSGQALLDRLLSKEEPSTASPWKELDECFRLRPGSMTLLAAATGMGKTTIAMQFARACIHSGRSCFFVNFEMAEDEMHGVLATQEHGAPYDPQTQEDFAAMIRAVTATINAKLPMYWGCSPEMNIDTAAARAKALHAQLTDEGKGLGLVIIDYLGGAPMSSEEARSKAARHEIMGARALRCKHLARALRVPVLVLAQLNREAEKAGNSATRAMIGDSYDMLRHADNVVLFSRPLPGQDSAATFPVLSVQKARKGRQGWFPLEWDWRTQTYSVDESKRGKA